MRLTALPSAACEARVGRHLDVVCDAVLGFGDAVREIGRHRGGNVLHERPARRDVQHLRAAANREQRQILFHRAPGEIDFELVAPWFGVLDGLVAILAVKNRIDVAAAGQQHTVECLAEPPADFR